MMFDEDTQTLEEINRKRTELRRSFRKIINKDRISRFEMDDMFNGL
ncbi:TPA: hypothetical protein HA361_04420 [Candidatus Woesearchaeota archaeon]|nr:hypothetical protein [Candidatus Woesearchaeota archaeon]HII68320.1 hypothetical protein [Candidatus Woesearchaeota archaeon]